MFCSLFFSKSKKEGINLYIYKYYVKGEEKEWGTERERKINTRDNLDV